MDQYLRVMVHDEVLRATRLPLSEPAEDPRHEPRAALDTAPQRQSGALHFGIIFPSTGAKPSRLSCIGFDSGP